MVHAAPTITNTIQILADGNAPFDPSTYNPTLHTNTGSDASATNNIVRAGQYIDYQVQVSISDEWATNIVYSHTLPVGFTWNQSPFPIGCLTSGVTPLSSITNAGRTLVCNIWDTPTPGTLSVDLRVDVALATANDTAIRLGWTLDSDEIVPVTAIDAPEVIVTKTPEWVYLYPQIDLKKRQVTRWISWYASMTMLTFPWSDGVTPGRIVPYVIALANKKTAPGMDANMNLTLEDQFTLLDQDGNPVPHSARLYTWSSTTTWCEVFGSPGSQLASLWFESVRYPYGTIWINSNADASKSAPNSGTIWCSQWGIGGPVTMNISGIDLRNLSGPTLNAIYAPLADPYISPDENAAWVYILYYWVPLTDIDNASSTLSGAYYRNTITGPGGTPFDVSSASGVSNYGPSTEPTGNNISNNGDGMSSSGHTMLIGTESNAMATICTSSICTDRVASIALKTASSSEQTVLQIFGALSRYFGIWDIKYGDRIATPNAVIGQSLRHGFYQDMSTYGTGTTAIVCEKINPNHFLFTESYPADSSIQYQGQLYRASNFIPLTRSTQSQHFYFAPLDPSAAMSTGGAVIIEYSTTPNIPNDRDASCSDADGPWYASMALAGTGVTKMRIKYTVPSTTQPRWVEYRGTMGIQIAPWISSGTFPVWMSVSYDSGTTWQNSNTRFTANPNNYASLNSIDPYYGFWPSSQYDGNYYSTADRVTVTEALARIDKDTVPSGATSFQVGKPISFILKPTLTGSLTLTGANYVIRDIMPPSMYYVHGSASRVPDTWFPQIDGSGNTILQWTFSNISPGDTLPNITYTANTETTMTSIVGLPNIAQVTYAWDVSPLSLRQDTYNLTLVQNSQYALFKRPVPSEVPVNGNLQYIVRYKNFTVAPNIPPASKYIDILPYNGDGILGARSKKPSSFTGTYTLTSLSGSYGETFEYTKRPHAQIKNDPCDVSNQESWVTSQPYCMLGLVGWSVGTATTQWCTEAQFWTPNCPANIGETTAFRMTVPSAININQLQNIVINIVTHNNNPGDLYTNTIGTRRQNFNLYTASNEATIHVYGASVGDRVWKDINLDGIQDIGETGIGGILVTLEHILSGSVISTQTTYTDGNGNYLFQNIPWGEYRMTVSAPWMPQTYDLDGLGTPHQTTFTLWDTEEKRDVDFGYNPTTASVGDTVWFDTNMNGVQEIWELGLSGVTMSLSGTTSTGMLINLMTLTDMSGKYLFSNLLSGSYLISATVSGWLIQTYDLDGTGTLHHTTFSLGATEFKSNVDFWYVLPLSSVWDKLWVDIAGDTTFLTGSDIPLEWVVVSLSGTDIYGNTVSSTTLTDTDGLYLFPDLIAGNYSVSVGEPGYIPLFDLDGHTGSSKNRTNFILGSGESKRDVDFIYTTTPDIIGSLWDTVWIDGNADGIYGSWELTLSGIVVTLEGRNVLAEIITLTGVTNSAGQYLFPGLYSGSYLVKVMNPPNDHVATYDLDGTGGSLFHPVSTMLIPSAHTSLVQLGAWSNRRDVDFWYRPIVTHVAGVVWLDPNASGIAPENASEYGFSGVTVTLSGTDIYGNGTLRTFITTSTGYYIFPNMNPGIYTIAVTRNADLWDMDATYDLDSVSTLDRVSFTLLTGESKDAINYGYRTTPIVIPSTSGGWSGGGGVSTSSAGVIVSTPTSPSPNQTTPSKTPSPTIPKKPTIKTLSLRERTALENAMNIWFILPKKLLDTGASGIPQWLRDRVSERVKILTEKWVYTEPQIYGTPWTKSLKNAPTDIVYWTEQLPEQDKNANLYIVIPSVGVVTPIIDIPEWDKAFSTLVSGKDATLSQYLNNGVLHYPRTPNPGEYGNMVIAGHSSYYTWSPGRYNTVFWPIIALDANKQVWVYKKNAKNTYDLYRYKITASYNTKPTDTSVMLPTYGKKEITLYTCTPIGGISGRWIIRGELIEK